MRVAATPSRRRSRSSSARCSTARCSTVLNLATCCLLAFHRLADFKAAAAAAVSGQTVSSISRHDNRLDGVGGVSNDEENQFEDLPEGFHNDVDSITVAVGGHHTCALEYRPGVDFGGPVRCWGANHWGQSTPSDDVFVQASVVERRYPMIKSCCKDVERVLL